MSAPTKEQEALKKALADNARLVQAIQKTIDDNGHLADGDNCTLIELVNALKEQPPLPVQEPKWAMPQGWWIVESKPDALNMWPTSADILLDEALAQPAPLPVQPVQEPVALLLQLRSALALASAICDAVPTREPGHLGILVNAQPDGSHGYRQIQEAEAALVKYLEAQPNLPAQEPVAQLLLQSKQNHERKFGPSAAADWIYSDVLELLDTTPPAAPVQTVVDNEAKSEGKPAETRADTGVERGGQLAPVQEPDHSDELTIAYLSGLHDGKKQTALTVQEPTGYWDGKFSKDGGATLYEVPQESMFGRKYPNIPLYATPPAAQPEQRKPLTGNHTTFVQRFTDAVAILCGAEPPADFVEEWLRNIEVNFVARLQEWVVNQDGTPQWAQGIVVLDAAYLLADSPVEGMQHEEAIHNIGGAKP